MGRVELDGLTKVFDDGEEEIVAVDHLDLDIKDGEFVVFVGPSGCGKSTTLRTIAGLEQITEGDIRIAGESVTGRKPKDRNIAMVFQNYALYPHKTARGNMSFGLELTTELSRDEIDQRVEEAASMMGIEELLPKKPGELSGGQQQRVALGRAIVRDPEVFLMDEPLSNLDAKLRTQMRTELQELQQRLGVSTIYVTHDQTEAMTMGDRIVVLRDGQLQQFGTPLECYHEPANQFVASFMGSPSMNFLEVRASADDEGTVLEHDTFSYPVSPEIAETLESASDDLTMGVRPEDIDLVDELGPDTVSATVDVVEPLGDMTYAYLSLGEQDLTVSVPPGYALSPGEEVLLRFPEERMYLFDGQSGDAVTHPEAAFEEAAAASAADSATSSS